MTDPNATPPPPGEPTPPPHGERTPPPHGEPTWPSYGGPTRPPYGGPTPPPAGGPTPPSATGPANYGQQYGQQPHQPAPAHQRPTRPDGLTSTELTWGGAAHWSSFVAAAVALGCLGPLIVMLTKGNESVWVRRQAVESLNFQLSILIYALVSAVLLFVLVGFVLLPLVVLTWLIFTIIASVKASRGEDYRYPVTIRLVH
jgi:uncharacterized Tic20 family protein